jgi:hypothetical protein
MNARNLWTAFAYGPTSIKLLTIIMILIWLIPLVMIMAGPIFFLERPPPPATDKNCLNPSPAAGAGVLQRSCHQAKLDSKE